MAGDFTFRSLTAGGYHTCGILPTGTARCWGKNSAHPPYFYGGQLGDGTTTDRLRPTRVRGDFHFAVLSAGEGHTCGITVKGKAWCWGSNLRGQLGDGTTTDRLVPTPVAGGLTFPVPAAETR